MTAANLLDLEFLPKLKGPGLAALRQAVNHCFYLRRRILAKGVRFQPQKVILLRGNPCQQGPRAVPVGPAASQPYLSLVVGSVLLKGMKRTWQVKR